MFIKICGIRTLEDALASQSAGADAIGFNLWPHSKRFISLEDARPILAQLKSKIELIAVMVNPEEAEVRRALEIFDTVQLHGNEPADFCRLFGARAMKAIRMHDAASLMMLQRYEGDRILIDADSSSFGGSGRIADWRLSDKAARLRKVILAGGLMPENVAQAIAAVKPFGVDVASGVESSAGVKDHHKIADFVVRARQAATQLPPEATK